jgi:hypothetical protein
VPSAHEVVAGAHVAEAAAGEAVPPAHEAADVAEVAPGEGVVPVDEDAVGVDVADAFPDEAVGGANAAEAVVPAGVDAAGPVVAEAAVGGNPVGEDAVGAVFAEAAAGANPADAAARPDPVVPFADAAALKAREAAANCDAALADPVADADNEFVGKMRGWLMTVVALFVAIAFQALVHPPKGMSFDSCNILSKSAWSTPSGAHSPPPDQSPISAASWAHSPPPDQSPTSSALEAASACVYMYSNTITMAMSLTLLVWLLFMGKTTSQFNLYAVKITLGCLSFTVATSFITGTPGSYGVRLGVIIIFCVYASVLVSIIIMRIRKDKREK